MTGEGLRRTVHRGGILLAGLLLLVPVAVDGAERELFRRGYTAFQEQRYGTARGVFHRLVRMFPDSPRGRDGRYFLRRMDMYGVREEPPPVLRVRLAEGSRITGRTRFRLAVRGPGDGAREDVPPDSEWTARVDSDSTVVITTDDRRRRGRPFLRLEPTAAGEDLVHDGTPYRGRFELRAGGGRVMLINVLPVHHYLYGVIRKELAPGWPRAAVKAQAVAARSYALYRRRRAGGTSYHLDSGGRAQVYGGRPAETRRVRRAVDITRGQVLVHRGRLVPAFFHANSGGHVETAGAIWTGSRTPYIVAKPDTWSLRARHARWHASISDVEINRALREKGYPNMDGDASLRVAERLPSGRALALSYRTAEGGRRAIDAETFRSAVGSDRVRSAWFETIRDREGRVDFRGRGWGHGVGMSQWGAHAMASAGVDYRRILSFYYQLGRLHSDFGPGPPEGEDDG